MGTVFVEDPLFGIAMHRLLTLAIRTDIILETAHRVTQNREH